MTNQTLPQGAYAALDGLQAQAEAAMLLFPGNDLEKVAAGRKALAVAHAQMAANERWVTRIVKAISASESELTVVTADSAWLELTFEDHASRPAQ